MPHRGIMKITPRICISQRTASACAQWLWHRSCWKSGRASEEMLQRQRAGFGAKQSRELEWGASDWSRESKNETLWYSWDTFTVMKWPNDLSSHKFFPYTISFAHCQVEMPLTQFSLLHTLKIDEKTHNFHFFFLLARFVRASDIPFHCALQVIAIMLVCSSKLWHNFFNSSRCLEFYRKCHASSS